MSLDPFAGKLPNLVQWILLESRWFLWMFRSRAPRSRSNCWYKRLLNIFRLLYLKYKYQVLIFIPPPPLKQGAYCFALVGQSVGWLYVDQAMSAQYFLTTRLESCQTSYSGCQERVDVPYWFSGHIFKGEGQTACLHCACCLLNILWPFDGYQTCYTLTDFRDCFMGHKVKVKLLIFISALSVQYVINHVLDNN